MVGVNIPFEYVAPHSVGLQRSTDAGTVGCRRERRRREGGRSVVGED